jgi:hypothetical protein
MSQNKISNDEPSIAEIKLITEYRSFLLERIDALKGSLNHVASSFSSDLTNSLEEFSKRINTKLRTIEERFSKNCEELEAIRAELTSKKFDEANFNNFSMVRNLDKTIKERDLKINQLESRIRYLEANSHGASAGASATTEVGATIKKATSSKGLTTKPESVVAAAPIAVHEQEPAPEPAKEKEDKFKDAPRVQDADGDIIIAVSAKKPRAKVIKKTEHATATAHDIAAAAAATAEVEGEKPKKSARKPIKKASKIIIEDADVVSAPIPVKVEHVPEPEVPIQPPTVDDSIDAVEAQRLADDEAMRLAEEEALEAERLAEKQEQQRLAEEEALEAELLAEELAAKAELEKKKKTETITKKPVIGKKDSKEVSQPAKKITSKTQVQAPAPATATKIEDEVAKPQANPAPTNRGYPDKLPEFEVLDVITVGGQDYYCDQRNQAVYQMINGDDIGAFLGYYDNRTEIITPVDAGAL